MFIIRLSQNFFLILILLNTYSVNEFSELRSYYQGSNKTVILYICFFLVQLFTLLSAFCFCPSSCVDGQIFHFLLYKLPSITMGITLVKKKSKFKIQTSKSIHCWYKYKKGKIFKIIFFVYVMASNKLSSY